jgi:diaminopimelate epimerase
MFIIRRCIIDSIIAYDDDPFISLLEMIHVRIRPSQPDANEVKMHENDVQCLAKYVFDDNYMKTKSFLAETFAGVLTICVRRGGYGDFTTTINRSI